MIRRVQNLDSDYYIRFISFDLIFKEKSPAIRYKHIVALENYLKENPRGKEWRKELGTNINKVMEKILGVDFETIKLYKRIGDRTKKIG